MAINVKTAFLSTLLCTSIFASDLSLELLCEKPLSSKDKELLYQNGVESIRYAGEGRYYLYTKNENISAFLRGISYIKSIKKLDDKKLDDELFKEKRGLGTLFYSDEIKLTVLFFEEMSKEEIESYFSASSIDIEVLSANKALRSATIVAKKSDLDRLKTLGKIEYIQKAHSIGLKNAKTRSYEGVDSVNESYGLDGSGTSVAIVDGGLVREDHIEFLSGSNSRVHTEGNYDFADHATHVAGTIAAKGVDKRAKGMAPKASIYSFSFYDGAFANMSVKIYQDYGILFSNHSYGYNEKSQLAKYDAEAAKEDRAVYQNPYLNIFIAAGNDGNDPSYPEYGKTKGPTNAKNVLTIGALNLNASAKANFSSNGPVSDGRIKPELCARGEGIYSTFAQNSSDYMWMNGTSMATPAATGMSLLILEAYKEVSGGYDIRHDTLESVLINSAVDVGREGPDYDTGFGMIDLKGAVDLIKSINSKYPLVHLDSIGYNQTKSFSFTKKSDGEFSATISWVDPSASPSASSSLVNDLDMVLVSKSTKRYYPYTLNPLNPKELAKQDRENHVDNVEKIYVKNLPKGEYRLLVKGSVVTTTSQEFTIASNVSISSQSNIVTIRPSRLKNFAKVIQSSIR